MVSKTLSTAALPLVYSKAKLVMRNPREALDRIWQSLEDLYGDPRGLLENAIQEIKWQRGLPLSKVSALQCYRDETA